MSTRKQLERALQKAERRDRKRVTKMKVSGKSVQTLAKILDKRR